MHANKRESISGAASVKILFPFICVYSRQHMSLSEIHAAIPHRPPFLLVDEIVFRTMSKALFAARLSAATNGFSRGTIQNNRLCRACCYAKRHYRPGRC